MTYAAGELQPSTAHMKYFVLLVALLAGGVLVAPAAPAAGCASFAIAKVSVLSSGKLLLNGRKSSLQAIDKAFQQLAQEHGRVWYYREDAAEQAPPVAIAVVKLVIKYHLPITLSTTPDFSNYIGQDGRPHPRKAEQCAAADVIPLRGLLAAKLRRLA